MPFKNTVHVISHVHWDREWYLPFQKHRMRLVELIDKLLYTIDNDESFKSFHLDGQFIVLEDYLDIKPEMEDKIKEYIEKGRIIVGPWYVLQDEYLTSSEANIRNMLLGFKLGEKYGSIAKVGYFPDSFGNISQVPQILKGFGIDCAVFGRGIAPVGFNNKVLDSSNQYHSEVLWESPDGSKVLGIFMANWYNLVP